MKEFQCPLCCLEQIQFKKCKERGREVQDHCSTLRTSTARLLVRRRTISQICGNQIT